MLGTNDFIGSHASETQSEPEEHDAAYAEGLIEGDAEESEGIDPKFCQNQYVTVYFILPNGQEEIILNYNMTFADTKGYQQFRDHGIGLGDFHSAMGRQAGADFKNKNDMDFKLSKLVKYIKKQGYPVENSFVSFYSADFQVQINCGPEPINKSISLSMSDLENNEGGESSVKLIFAKGIKGDFYDTEANIDTGRASEMNKADSAVQRNKERSIGFIIEKVSQWRKLYNGFYDEKQELKRMSLEDAAAKVGVSKKSLDDYLSQIRLGRFNGFDFNKNKDEKVGRLRYFNKEIKKAK